MVMFLSVHAKQGAWKAQVTTPLLVDRLYTQEGSVHLTLASDFRSAVPLTLGD